MMLGKTEKALRGSEFAATVKFLKNQPLDTLAQLLLKLFADGSVNLQERIALAKVLFSAARTKMDKAAYSNYLQRCLEVMNFAIKDCEAMINGSTDVPAVAVEQVNLMRKFASEVETELKNV
jgi:hypothetical protein